MQRTPLVLLAAATMIGCKTEDKNYTPIIECDTEDGSHLCETTSGTASTAASTTASSSASTSPDTTAGECGDYAVYHCRGWAAGVYVNTSGSYNFDFSAAPEGEPMVDCLEYNVCIPFAGYPDNEIVYEACRTICEEMAFAWPENPTSGLPNWTFDHTACVFADEGNNGTVPGPPTVLGSVPGHCDNIPPSSNTDPQCTLEGCVQEDQCPAESQSCEGYSPSSHVTSSLSVRTYTTTIHQSFLSALEADFFDQLYACDDGFWTWSTSATPDKWRMQGLTPGDLLYLMGFRNNDERIRIRRNVSGAPWYDLYASTMGDGYAKMADAFAALGDYTSFVVEFHRGSAVYTMNLTLN